MIFLIIGCSSNSIKNNEKPIVIDSLIERHFFEKDELDNKNFDILKYKKSVDSLLVDIFNKDTYSNLVLDSIFKGVSFNVLKETPLENIFNEAIKNERYIFNLSNNNNFSFIILTYENKYITDSIFNVIEKESIENNWIPPGLTYTNDYLIAIENNIYWINTSCLYSYYNHLKLVNILKSMLDIQGHKSIECECGKVTCISIRE
jgi:hypothetical protein